MGFGRWQYFKTTKSLKYIMWNVSYCIMEMIPRQISHVVSEGFSWQSLGGRIRISWKYFHSLPSILSKWPNYLTRKTEICEEDLVSTTAKLSGYSRWLLRPDYSQYRIHSTQSTLYVFSGLYYKAQPELKHSFDYILYYFLLLFQRFMTNKELYQYTGTLHKRH